MKKLLVWDGDQTLWDGTYMDGDDVTVSAMRYNQVHALMERGVLQAVASRNLLGDVQTILHRFGLDDAMLTVQAGLHRSKPDMVRTVMLVLGLVNPNDVVFADDNPSHREEVELAIPGVTTVDPADIQRAMDVHFTKASYTDEDRNRVRRYKSEQARQQAETAYDGDRTDFLRGCEMRLRVRAAGASDMPRVMDLTERANQYSAREGYVSVDAARFDGSLYVGEAADRFGDYGLSTVAVMDCAHIRLFVVSCRLAGKGLGSAFLGTLLGLAFERYGARVASAGWQPTDYNGGIDALFGWYGFALSDEPGCTVGRRVARLGRDDWQPDKRPDWVTIQTVIA
jgi:methoxymalonate biosynthesis protein